MNLYLVLRGDPVSKGRPRVGANGRTYTPERTRTAESAVGMQMRAAMRGRPILTEPVAVILRFFTATKRRVDLDNLQKLVLDACNGVVWVDDSQVVELHGYLTLGDPAPRTEVSVAAMSEVP